MVPIGLGTFLLSISTRFVCVQKHNACTALKNIFHRATRHSSSARTPPIARRRQLFAEQLEARRLLAADASVNITGASQSLLGEEVNFVVTFDNASTDPTDNVGYSPFVDIVMPATGDAPPHYQNNGISF